MKYSDFKVVKIFGENKAALTMKVTSWFGLFTEINTITCTFYRDKTRGTIDIYSVYNIDTMDRHLDDGFKSVVSYAINSYFKETE